MARTEEQVIDEIVMRVVKAMRGEMKAAFKEAVETDVAGEIQKHVRKTSGADGDGYDSFL